MSKILMARPNWRYINIPKEQADALDEFVKKEGKRYGITTRNDMVSMIIREYMAKHPQDKHDSISTRSLRKRDTDFSMLL